MNLPKLKMTREQFYEMQYLTNKCDKEISGLGTIIFDDDNNFVVEKLFLLEQECSSAETTLDANAISKCLYDARECKGTLSFWWHSHVNMGAFFSAQDVITIKEQGANGFMLGLVLNKRGEYKIALGTSKPRVYADSGIELEITENINQSLIDRLDSEFKEKVKLPVYNYGQTSFGYGYDDDFHGYDERGVYRGFDFSSERSKSVSLVGRTIPSPMIYSETTKRWIDNPEYLKYKRESARLDKLTRGNLQQSAVKEYEQTQLQDEKEQKLGDAFEKMGAIEIDELMKEYERAFHIRCTDPEDLKEFYISQELYDGVSNVN